MLTQHELKKDLNYDHNTGLFTWIKGGTGRNTSGIAGYIDISTGYCLLCFKGKKYYAHRLAWFYFYGEFPLHEIDHINSIKNDNRIVNLRQATRKQNQQNFRNPNKNNTSGYLGVTFDKNKKKFRAQITVDGKCKKIGWFNDAKNAHSAYLKAKRELHEFCTI